MSLNIADIDIKLVIAKGQLHAETPELDTKVSSANVCQSNAFPPVQTECAHLGFHRNAIPRGRASLARPPSSISPMCRWNSRHSPLPSSLPAQREYGRGIPIMRTADGTGGLIITAHLPHAAQSGPVHK